MTTNSMLRMRSKSISDVFAASDWDEEKEDLIPRTKEDKKSAFDKWKSSLNLNPRTNDQQTFERRTSRANSIFSRPPPSHPRSRRQSLAVTIRRPSVIKDDLKKMWENRRASLSSLKTQITDRITGRSSESLATSRNQNSQQRVGRVQNEEEYQFEDRTPPPFFIVDRNTWNLPSQ